MEYELLEFDGPHQPDDEAAAILKEILTDHEDAEPGELVCIGYPVLCTNGPDGYAAQYDKEFPMTEIIIKSSSGGLTLGTEFDVPDAVMAKTIKWLNRCNHNPDNLANGMKLCNSLADSQELPSQGIHLVLWYFSDFIICCSWKPTSPFLGIARSRLDGSPIPGNVLVQMCLNWRELNGSLGQVLSAQRQEL